MAENLIAVLEEHLSQEEEWTEELKANWEEALQVISKVMIDAAQNPEQYQKSLENAGYQPDGFKATDARP